MYLISFLQLLEQQEMEKQMYQHQIADKQRQATIEAQRMAEYKRQQDMV